MIVTPCPVLHDITKVVSSCASRGFEPRFLKLGSLVALLNKTNIKQHLARENICVSQENNVPLIAMDKQK